MRRNFFQHHQKIRFQQEKALQIGLERFFFAPVDKKVLAIGGEKGI